jgi:hypothetical protein
MATRKIPPQATRQSSARDQATAPSTAPEAALAAAAALESSGRKPRFHFFVIDAGWESVPATVLRENLGMIREFLREFQNDDSLYVLPREQSIALLQQNPDLIGKDPVILVHDLHAEGGQGESGYHGFRLCMGLLNKPEMAMYGLQRFLRFISEHRKSQDIEADIRKRLQKKGLEGAISVIREGTQEAVG